MLGVLSRVETDKSQL